MTTISNNYQRNKTKNKKGKKLMGRRKKKILKTNTTHDRKT